MTLEASVLRLERHCFSEIGYGLVRLAFIFISHRIQEECPSRQRWVLPNIETLPHPFVLAKKVVTNRLAVKDFRGTWRQACSLVQCLQSGLLPVPLLVDACVQEKVTDIVSRLLQGTGGILGGFFQLAHRQRSRGQEKGIFGFRSGLQQPCHLLRLIRLQVGPREQPLDVTIPGLLADRLEQSWTASRGWPRLNSARAML